MKTTDEYTNKPKKRYQRTKKTKSNRPRCRRRRLPGGRGREAGVRPQRLGSHLERHHQLPPSVRLELRAVRGGHPGVRALRAELRVPHVPLQQGRPHQGHEGYLRRGEDLSLS